MAETSSMCASRTCLGLLALGLFSCAGPSPVFEETRTPQLFSSGVVSSEENEFATSFSPGGRAVYFNRVDDQGRIWMLKSHWREGHSQEDHSLGGQWSSPEPVAFSDGTFRDVDPFVASHGERLFFTSDRNEDGETPSADFDIWVAELEGEKWGAPKRLPSPPNSTASEAFVSVARDGTLYFGSKNTEDGVRRVLRSRPVDDDYGPVEEVDLGLEKGVAAANPLILPDGKTLIFTSRDLGGQGAVDLFVSYCDAEGTWSPPEPLSPPINSPFADFAPGLGPQGRVLFFTSQRPGLVAEGETEGRPPGDLYYVELPNEAR